MNITQLEKEIIKALEINSKVDWSAVDPSEEFKDLGGAGVEVMSGSQDPSQTNYFLKLANNFDLLSSCGSDFHGKGISHRALGNIRELPNEAIPIWTKWNRFETIFH